MTRSVSVICEHMRRFSKFRESPVALHRAKVIVFGIGWPHFQQMIKNQMADTRTSSFVVTYTPIMRDLC